MLVDVIRGILEWIRDRLGTEAIATSLPYLKREVSKDRKCELKLLAGEGSDAFPGIVRLWEINHKDATHSFYLLLINIAQCRPPSGKNKSSWRRSLEAKVRLELKAQDTINASHLWLVTCSPKATTIERDDAKYKYIDAIACLCINMVSDEARQHINQGDKLAIAVTTRIAGHLLEMQSSESWSWQALVIDYPWTIQMQKLARIALRKTDWYIQPPRSRTARSPKVQ